MKGNNTLLIHRIDRSLEPKGWDLSQKEINTLRTQ